MYRDKIVTGRQEFVPVCELSVQTFLKMTAGPQVGEKYVLDATRERVRTLVADIEAGIFPPRPHELRICSYCAYAPVCRKDYVGDE